MVQSAEGDVQGVMMEMYQHIERGTAHPLGAVPDEQGVNFSIYSQHATSVELLLFAKPDDPEPVQVIPLDPLRHRTFHFWHVYVRGLRPGMHYAYRFDGSHDLHGKGDRSNRNKVVLDPYAREITTRLWHHLDACGPDDNVRTCLRGMVVEASGYDWQGDLPLKRPMIETIIYEMHVGGFTRSPSSGCHSPGTFAGVIEKIPYLKALGITAVELMPIFAFDEQGNRFLSPVDGQPLKNYWGYDPICHFAPHPAYGRSPADQDHVRDFRDMVKALHQAEIEVILDVVFNHTGEGDHLGPTISFKGIDNSIYYDLDPRDRQYYMDYSGCGNTLKCNHPVVAKLIAECLEYWVEEMHVDGFRLDEASVLARGGDGRPIKYPPVLWHIELNERLADTKFIVEAWDAGGLYQVGNFPIDRWSEWNGRYRDAIRRFVRGDPGMVGAVATCIAGSADLYQEAGRMPVNGINFITCHDGFTLNDLVSYHRKHNEANGEENRDGSNVNWSWNCGVEGETSDPAIEALRQQQIKNFLAVLMLSQGIPMILAGDEIRRTQRGNNNAYCQDNEISWFDWKLVEKNEELFRFFKLMIAFRKHHPHLCREHFFTGEPDEHGVRDIEWHGCRLFSPGWHDPHCRTLAFTIWGLSQDDDLHVMLNMAESGLDFEIPPLKGRRWLKVIDTALPSPLDIAEPGEETAVPGSRYHVSKHSVVVLVGT
jgi:isoamylase